MRYVQMGTIMSPARLDRREIVALCGEARSSRGVASPFIVRLADHGPDEDAQRSLPGHHAALPRSGGTSELGRS